MFVRINGLAIIGHGEEHGALKAVPRKNLAHHGHRFFGAVFLITGNEHDVFAIGFSLGVKNKVISVDADLVCC